MFDCFEKISQKNGFNAIALEKSPSIFKIFSTDLENFIYTTDEPKLNIFIKKYYNEMENKYIKTTFELLEESLNTLFDKTLDELHELATLNKDLRVIVLENPYMSSDACAKNNMLCHYFREDNLFYVMWLLGNKNITSEYDNTIQFKVPIQYIPSTTYLTIEV
jgi:hypothetical protein